MEVLVVLLVVIFLYKRIRNLTIYCTQLEYRIMHLEQTKPKSIHKSVVNPKVEPLKVKEGEHLVIEDVEVEEMMDKEIELELMNIQDEDNLEE